MVTDPGKNTALLELMGGDDDLGFSLQLQQSPEGYAQGRILVYLAN